MFLGEIIHNTQKIQKELFTKYLGDLNNISYFTNESFEIFGGEKIRMIKNTRKKEI
jgi:hypothetical protein